MRRDTSDEVNLPYDQTGIRELEAYCGLYGPGLRGYWPLGNLIGQEVCQQIDSGLTNIHPKSEAHPLIR